MFTDFTSAKLALNLTDGTTEHIAAALSNDVRALLHAVELNQLTSRVDDERHEVMLNILLVLGLIGLALSGE